MKSRTFQRGSGCFKCSSCGRACRVTPLRITPDICGPCYELAGFENGVTDNCEDHTARYLSDALSLLQGKSPQGWACTNTQLPGLGAAVLAEIGPN